MTEEQYKAAKITMDKIDRAKHAIAILEKFKGRAMRYGDNKKSGIILIRIDENYSDTPIAPLRTSSLLEYLDSEIDHYEEEKYSLEKIFENL